VIENRNGEWIADDTEQLPRICLYINKAAGNRGKQRNRNNSVKMENKNVDYETKKH
jgi:hypothetical protein